MHLEFLSFHMFGMSACVHAYLYIYICAYMYIYMYTYTHIHDS